MLGNLHMIRQGDGERMAEIEPQMVYVLEMDMNTKK